MINHNQKCASSQQLKASSSKKPAASGRRAGKRKGTIIGHVKPSLELLALNPNEESSLLVPNIISKTATS
jgi:hypothetical protein